MSRESTYAPFFLLSSDVFLLSKGHLWSVCMKLNQAAVSQRKVMPMVAAEERGTAAAGGALHVFTSNGPFTFNLTDWKGWKERRRNNKNKSELLDQRRVTNTINSFINYYLNFSRLKPSTE